MTTKEAINEIAEALGHAYGTSNPTHVIIPIEAAKQALRAMKEDEDGM